MAGRAPRGGRSRRGGPDRPSRSPHSATGIAAGASPATICSRPSRRRGTSATATSTRSPLVNRSPATPAKPSRRRSTGGPPPSGGADAGAASAASTRSQNPPSSPSTSSSPGRVGHSARSSTRGSTIPFQRFRSRRRAMSWFSACAGASVRGGVPKATPRERAPPAVTSVKRACSRSSPIAVTCSKRAAGTSSVGCGLPRPNGRSRSSSSASSRPSTPPGTTASTCSHGIRSAGLRAAPACAARARRKGSTASASSSTPAAMRWPPKRTRC